MPGNKLNKQQEGFQLSNPTAFLTDRPGAFATWLAATYARCTEFGVGPNDIFGCNLTTTELEDFDKVWDASTVGTWNVRELQITQVTDAWNKDGGMYGDNGKQVRQNFTDFMDANFPTREWDANKKTLHLTHSTELCSAEHRSSFALL